MWLASLFRLFGGIFTGSFDNLKNFKQKGSSGSLKTLRIFKFRSVLVLQKFITTVVYYILRIH